MTAIDVILAVAAVEATSRTETVCSEVVDQSVRILEMIQQARFLASERNYLEAEGVCLEACTAAGEAVGKNSQLYGLCLEDLGVMRICQGKMRQADITLTESHSVLKTVFGDEHPDVVRVFERLHELCHS